jgi:hypothetical protein
LPNGPISQDDHGIEAGYLGFCVGRPFAVPLPWIDDDPPAGSTEARWANRDL